MSSHSIRQRLGLAALLLVFVAVVVRSSMRLEVGLPRHRLGPSATLTRVASVSLTSDTLLAHWLRPPQLVAVSALVDWPDYWQGERPPASIPRLTGAVEPVVALHPDLAVVSDVATPELGAKLRSGGIETHELAPPRHLHDVLADVRRLGKRLGLTREAEQWCAELDLRIALVREHGTRRPRWRAIVLESSYAYGKATLIDDILATLGVVNVLGERGQCGLRSLSAEQMLAWRPDIVFVAISGGTAQRDARDELAAIAGYASLSDLMAKVPCWVFGIPRAELSAMSPKIIDALESMDRTLTQWAR